MTTIMELLKSKSEEEVYDYLFEVENFLAFFKEESKYLNVDSTNYESTGTIKYVTDNVFLNIASEVDKINHLTTVFWGELCFRYLITFHPYYQDCEEIVTDILKQLKKPSKADFEKLMSNEDVLCVKTILSHNNEIQFAENCIYSAISVNLETKEKNDVNKRIVTLELRHNETICYFVELGKNAEQLILNKLKSCFVPISKVISVYRESIGLNKELVINKLN